VYVDLTTTRIPVEGPCLDAPQRESLRSKFGSASL
jgi:hypothetical protein